MYVNCCSSQHRCYTTLFFFNDTATTEIYTLSLHDALPISDFRSHRFDTRDHPGHERDAEIRDRKSTRLNSSHGYISYAVFCLKKMKYVDSAGNAPLATVPSITASLERRAS